MDGGRGSVSRTRARARACTHKHNCRRLRTKGGKTSSDSFRSRIRPRDPLSLSLFARQSFSGFHCPFHCPSCQQWRALQFGRDFLPYVHVCIHEHPWRGARARAAGRRYILGRASVRAFQSSRIRLVSLELYARATVAAARNRARTRSRTV